MAKKAAETVVLVVDEEGIESLISELLKGVGDNQACLLVNLQILILVNSPRISICFPNLRLLISRLQLDEVHLI